MNLVAIMLFTQQDFHLQLFLIPEIAAPLIKYQAGIAY